MGNLHRLVISRTCALINPFSYSGVSNHAIDKKKKRKKSSTFEDMGINENTITAPGPPQTTSISNSTGDDDVIRSGST